MLLEHTMKKMEHQSHSKEKAKLIEPILKYRDLKGYISDDGYDKEFNKWYDMPINRLKQMSSIYTTKLENEEED